MNSDSTPPKPTGNSKEMTFMQMVHDRVFGGAWQLRNSPDISWKKTHNGIFGYFRTTPGSSPAAAAPAPGPLILQFIYQFGDYIGAEDDAGNVYAVAKPMTIRCSIPSDQFGSYVYGTDFQSRISTPNPAYDSQQRTETQVVVPAYAAGIPEATGTPTEIIAVTASAGLAKGMNPPAFYVNGSPWFPQNGAPPIVTDPTDVNFPAGTLVTLVQIAPGSQAWTKIS
jgi:hypothetical protein